MLEALTNLNEEIETLFDRQAVLVAVLRDRNPVNVLHREVRTTFVGSSRVVDTRDVRKAKLRILGQIDIAHATRADLLQDLVVSEGLADHGVSRGDAISSANYGQFT